MLDRDEPLSVSSKSRAPSPERHSGTAVWTAEHVRLISAQKPSTAPVIAEGDVRRVSPELDVWDAWPVQDPGGAPAQLPDGSTLWMALGSPRYPDPDERHAHARIHLLHLKSETWEHLGPVMPQGFSPGSREWSGSAVLSPGSAHVALYFTAAGRRGEPGVTFEQRVFCASATLVHGGARPRLEDWRDLREIVQRDPAYYMASDSGRAEVGAIKAFRDPCYFVDPVDGAA
jgi:levansucrase